MKEETSISFFSKQGTITLLVGFAGSGKSYFLMELAKCIQNGTPFLNHFPAQRANVVIFDSENPQEEAAKRLKALQVPENGVRFIHFCQLDIEADFQTFRRKVKESDIVIFDSLGKFHHRDENDNSEMKLVLKRFRELANDGKGIVIVHHSPKPHKDFRKISAGRGAAEIIHDVDMAFYFESRANNVKEVTPIKERLYAAKPIKFQIQVISENRTLLTYLEQTKLLSPVLWRKPVEQIFRDWQGGHPGETGISRMDLIELIMADRRCKKRKAEAILHEAVKHGEVISGSTGSKTRTGARKAYRLPE